MDHAAGGDCSGIARHLYCNLQSDHTKTGVLFVCLFAGLGCHEDLDMGVGRHGRPIENVQNPKLLANARWEHALPAQQGTEWLQRGSVVCELVGAAAQAEHRCDQGRAAANINAYAGSPIPFQVQRSTVCQLHNSDTAPGRHTASVATPRMS